MFSQELPQKAQHDRKLRGEDQHPELSERVCDNPHDAVTSARTKVPASARIEDDIRQSLKAAEAEYLNVLMEQSLNRFQFEITMKMRTTLIDWLVEVSDEFGLVPETLYLSASLVDRVLLREQIPRRSLQLLGISCILIASKFEEIYSPHISELCDITDNTYCPDQVVQMERRVLEVLQFRVCQPTVNTFLMLYKSAVPPDDTVYSLSSYLCELTLLDCRFYEYRMSLIAATAVRMSQLLLGHDDPSTEFQKVAGYGEVELIDCSKLIQDFVISTTNLSALAVYEKYSNIRFNQVATKLQLCEWNWPV